MLAKLSRGALVVSVDLEVDTEGSLIRDTRQIYQTCNRLVQLLARYSTAATWAVTDPAESPATDTILSKANQEVAVLGDNSWVGRAVGRRRFANELSRRLVSARALGLSISTLALSRARLCGNLDLLVKNGVSMIRPSSEASKSRQQKMGPTTVRYGVWQLPSRFDLPGSKQWFTSSGRLAFRRAIRQAVSANQVVHLTVNGQQMARSPSSGFRLLEQFLYETVRVRQQGLLATKTLQQVAAELAMPRREKIAESILRRAA